MASKTRKRKPVPADVQAAGSWIGKPIKDAYTSDSVGLVHGVEESDDGKVRLLARFPGETVSRRILLEVPQDPKDLEFLVPGQVRARYRPLTDADLQRLNLSK
jgi:hypothetical protein